MDLEKLESLHLTSGSHASVDDGMCLLEAAAWLAGEPHSDRPACVCRVIAAFGRPVNDWMDDESRQKLRPVLPLMIGTVGSVELQKRRAFRLADWAVREIAPMALEAHFPAEAAKLRALSPVVDSKSALEARYAANAVSAAASAAASSANAAHYAAGSANAAASANAYAANAANAAYVASANDAAASANDAAASAANAGGVAHYASAAERAGIVSNTVSVLRELCEMKEMATSD